ncbi:choice-of-anchor X domain-containing protein [Dasania marina]|uniref:choice-of-anchor X domain-containing protein n=1 Tax=Dasania marina TaxID=471499 RepID=UPI000377BDDD|nr:choice-of-anchor X domain-containing protein [Dasania marina]
MKYIIKLLPIFLFLSTVSIAEPLTLPLLPLTQDYKTLDGTQVSNYFSLTGTSSIITVAGLTNSELSISLPNGEALTEINAVNHGFTWKEVPAVVDPNKTLIVLEGHGATLGNYPFILSPQPGEIARLSTIDRSTLQTRSMISAPGHPIEPTKLFSVTTVLLDGRLPAQNAHIDMQVIDASGTVVNSPITLQDNGISPDSTANDGVYTAATSVDNAGQYEAIFRTSYGDSKGHSYQSFEVTPQEIAFNGSINIEKTDTNNNGLIDIINVTPVESIPRQPNSYQVILEIKGGKDQTLTKSVTINNPSAAIVFKLTANELKGLGSQPWTVASVNAWKEAKPLGLWPINQALEITDSELEKPPINIIGVVSDQGVDNDGDAIFDALQVVLKIDVQQPGRYGITLDLSAPDGQLLSSSYNSSIYLSSTDQIARFTFLGSDIGSGGQDGPYEVTNVLVYPLFSASDKLAKIEKNAGITNTYTCEQFAGCNTSLESEIRRIAEMMCDKHGHSLIVKLNKISALSNKHPDVAEKQLSALYHRAKILERSGSCPPAQGWEKDNF